MKIEESSALAKSKVIWPYHRLRCVCWQKSAWTHFLLVSSGKHQPWPKVHTMHNERALGKWWRIQGQRPESRVTGKQRTKVWLNTIMTGAKRRRWKKTISISFRCTFKRQLMTYLKIRIMTLTGSLAMVMVNKANAGLNAVKAQPKKAVTVIFNAGCCLFFSSICPKIIPSSI